MQAKMILISAIAVATGMTNLPEQASGELIVHVDPGPIGATYEGRWSTSRFDLDEPLSKVTFHFIDGKLINLRAKDIQSWLFEFNTHNHGLSQNYLTTKTLAFLDADGQQIARNRYSSSVNTQEGLAFLRSSESYVGIAAIEVTYDPAVPEVGPDAKVSLRFNQRSTPGILSVVEAVPGDFNFDGAVNIADYTTWRDAVGGEPGALYNDPTGQAIGSDQYDLWRANFGVIPNGNASGLRQAVPEPTSLLLIALIVVPLVQARCAVHE